MSETSDTSDTSDSEQELQELRSQLKRLRWVVNFSRITIVSLVLVNGVSNYYRIKDMGRWKQETAKYKALEDRVNGLQALVNNVMRNCGWRAARWER